MGDRYGRRFRFEFFRDSRLRGQHRERPVHAGERDRGRLPVASKGHLDNIQAIVLRVDHRSLQGVHARGIASVVEIEDWVARSAALGADIPAALFLPDRNISEHHRRSCKTRHWFDDNAAIAGSFPRVDLVFMGAVRNPTIPCSVSRGSGFLLCQYIPSRQEEGRSNRPHHDAAEPKRFDTAEGCHQYEPVRQTGISTYEHGPQEIVDKTDHKNAGSYCPASAPMAQIRG